MSNLLWLVQIQAAYPPALAAEDLSTCSRVLLAFLDRLFRRATLIVEGNHAFGRAGFSEASTGLPGSPIRRTAAIGPFARWRLDPTTLCHRLLGRLPAGPLVPAETRLRIDEAYREDWAFVVDCIIAQPYRRS